VENGTRPQLMIKPEMVEAFSEEAGNIARVSKIGR
jgi:hypothetical protein